jgi:hypothetical protein
MTALSIYWFSCGIVMVDSSNTLVTGISSFGICGWIINFGLNILIKEGKYFSKHGANALKQ